MSCAKNMFRLCVAVVLTAGLLGCGGNNNSVITKAYAGPDVPLNVPVEQRVTPAMLVIRYPAAMDLDGSHRAAMLTAYRGGWQPNGLQITDEQVEQGISERLSKTVYYVAELYRTLEAHLPANSVFLSPCTLGMDMKWHDSVTMPPHALRLDFTMAVSLNRIVSGGDNWYWDTLGSRISPCAWLYFNKTDAVVSDFQYLSILREVREGKVKPDVRKDAANTWSLYYGGTPERWNAVADRAEKFNVYLFDDTLGFGHPNEYSEWYTYQGAVPRPFAPLWDAYADMIIDVLNTADWQRLSGARMADYRRCIRIDKVPAAQQAPLLKEFVKAELDFLGKQDQQVVADIYDGEFGKSMRETLAAETKYLADLQDSRDRESTTNALAMLSMSTAMIGQTAAIQAHSVTPMSNLNYMNNINMTMMMAANSSSRETHLRSALSASLSNHFHRVLQKQVEYVIQTSRGQRRVRVTSLGGMRDEFAKICDELGTPVAKRS